MKFFLKANLFSALLMIALFAVGGSKVSTEKEQVQVVFESYDKADLQASFESLGFEVSVDFIDSHFSTINLDADLVYPVEMAILETFPLNLGTVNVNLFVVDFEGIKNKGSPA